MPHRRQRANLGKLQGTRITFNRGGSHFEILCDSAVIARAADIKQIPSLEDIILGDLCVYKKRGLKNGDRATGAELEKAFGTSRYPDCITAILVNKYPSWGDNAHRRLDVVGPTPEASVQMQKVAQQSAGPFGLPSFWHACVSAEVVEAACLAWIGSLSGWSHNIQRVTLVMQWLKHAMHLSRVSQAVEIMSLRILARCEPLPYHAETEDLSFEHKAVLAPLKHHVQKLVVAEDAPWLQYAKDNNLRACLEDIKLEDEHTSDRARLLSQQPYLSIMDSDLYPLIDHICAREGFTFTDTFFWCAMEIITQFLDPLFTSSNQLVTEKLTSTDYRRLEPKTAWMIENSGQCSGDILESFGDWQRSLPDDAGYDSGEEPDDDLMASWKAYHSAPLAMGAPVLDSLRGEIVSATPEAQLFAWSALQKASQLKILQVENHFPKVADVSTGSPQDCDKGEYGLPRFVISVLFNSGLTFSQMLGSPSFPEAVRRTKQSPHPDGGDDDDVDMTVEVLRALLPKIGDAEVKMVGELQLLLDLFAKVRNERPTIWPMILAAEGLGTLSKTCRALLCALEQDGSCKDGIWTKCLVANLSAKVSFDEQGSAEVGAVGRAADVVLAVDSSSQGLQSMQLVCRNIAGDELCSVLVKDPRAQRWREIEASLLDAVGRRDVTMKFVLPDGSQLSKSDDDTPMSQLLPGVGI